MPYTPITFASFAGFARGSLFDPIRRTPTHDWAARNGAVFEDVGLWKRAHYFPRSSSGKREDMHAAGHVVIDRGVDDIAPGRDRIDGGMRVRRE